MSQTVQPQHAPVTHRRPTGMWSSAGGRLFVASWCSLLVVDLTRGSPDTVALVALAVLVAACSRGQRAWVGLAAAIVAWCFMVGFVVHAHGELGPQRPGDLATLSLVALLAALVRPRHPHEGAR